MKQIKKIYKVRAWVNKTARRSVRGFAPAVEKVFYKEAVIVNNLKRVKAVYGELKNEASCSQYYSGYSGAAELFEPHIFDNGELAYWPDDEKYIEKYTFGM
jgi:hypothetical protein